MMNYTSINPYLGLQVNLSYPDAMNTDSEILKDLLYNNRLLVFKNWHNCSSTDLVKFSEKFGIPWKLQKYKNLNEAGYQDILGNAYTVYSNKSYRRLDNDVGIPWHVDVANEPNMERYPTRLLYCVELPTHYEGLTTDFANLAYAYENLNEDEKQLFESSYFVYQSWQNIGTNIQELSAVAIHPYTKKKFLRFNAVSQKEGWIRNWVQYDVNGNKNYLSNDILKKYIDDFGNKYKYCHAWEIGDLLVFDNWATMHRKGSGNIFQDSQGLRSYIRITVDTGLET